MTHAPTPWRIPPGAANGPRAAAALNGVFVWIGRACEGGADELVLCVPIAGREGYAESLRDAQFVIAACNAHDEFMRALRGASHALRSFQYGNASDEFAKNQADAIDAVLARIAAPSAGVEAGS